MDFLLLREPPQRLHQFLEGDDDQAKEFCLNIQRYNVAHAFTSIGTLGNNSHVEGRNHMYLNFTERCDICLGHF
jgi:hypothetical protein